MQKATTNMGRSPPPPTKPMADSPPPLFSNAMDFFLFYHNILRRKPPSPFHHKAMELVIPTPELLTAKPPLLLKEQHFSSFPVLVISPLSEVDVECTKKRPSSLQLIREDEISSPSSCKKLQSPLLSPAIKLQRIGNHHQGRIRSYKSLSQQPQPLPPPRPVANLGYCFSRSLMPSRARLPIRPPW